ncbi:MAG: hypothetical protein WC538_18770 [Thermoanaerobaculia bacterium]
MTESSSGPERTPLERGELLLAAVVVVAALVLHAVFLTQSGGLWRDEVNSLNLAKLDLSGIAKNLEYDSFPIGWFVLLKCWTIIAPAGDLSLRVFGVVIGLALIAAVWLAGRSMTGRTPLLALALLVFDAGTVRFGDSIRGYGVGTLFGVLAYWSLWRLGQRRDARSFWIAAAASIVAVHLLYFNAAVVFASCAGAATRGAFARSVRDVMRPLLVGAIAAVTLVPYVGMFTQARRWNDLLRYDIGPVWLSWMWQTAHAGSGPVAIILWDVALAAVALLSILVLVRRGKTMLAMSGLEHHAVAFFAGTVAYVVFLLRLGYYTSPWYYLALGLLVAVPLDALAGSVTGVRGRAAVIVLAVVHLAAAFGPAIAFTSERLTNVDIVAAELTTQTRTGDLVVVIPWQSIVSWGRYYHGPAVSVSVPPVRFTEWHRYDLFQNAMDDPAVMKGLLVDVDAALARGSRVFVVRNVGGSSRIPRHPPAPRIDGQGDAIVLFDSHLEAIGASLVEMPPFPAAAEFESLAVWQVRMAAWPND